MCQRAKPVGCGIIPVTVSQLAEPKFAATL
jgi:hypothetical protein